MQQQTKRTKKLKNKTKKQKQKNKKLWCRGYVLFSGFGFGRILWGFWFL